MTASAAAKRSSPWADALMMLISLLVSIAVAEGAVRFLNGQPLFAFPLPDPVGSVSVRPEVLDGIPLAAGVDRGWFASDPAPLPNRTDPPKGWQELFDKQRLAWNGASFQPSDAFKVWNTGFVGDPCKSDFFRQAPGQLYVYDPADGRPSPTYRFYPNVTLPDRLVTNQIGWRGRPIETPRNPRTIRIVFAGSSTVVEGHFVPFSYPEFVGHWLNRWSEARKLDVRFEVLNSARESNISTDIANVVRTEVLPLRPDLVVYYEGGNQFQMSSVVPKVPEGRPVRPAGADTAPPPGWLQDAARYSALVGRVQAMVGMTASGTAAIPEWRKPAYDLVWPAGLDERDPQLDYPDLPVNLGVIERDLDRIRADLAGIGSDFALSSFAWMVKDGLMLDPVRHKYIIEQLNAGYWPFRFRDIERLVTFENRLFAKYARVHGLPFVDVAGQLPLDPDLFIDAVHTSYAGTRLRAWITLQALIPVVEKHLADRSWPRASGPQEPLPTFTPREIKLSCPKPQ